MDAPVFRNLRRTNATYQSIRNTVEGGDAPLASVTTEQRTSVRRGRITPHLVRLIGAAALAAALIATLTGIPVGSPNTEAPDQVASSEQMATSLEGDGPSEFLDQGQAGYSAEEQMETQGGIAEVTSVKADRSSGFLNQGRAGYSVKEQMEILEEIAAGKVPKADRLAGFLNQGRAGYSIREQMEILEETTRASPESH